MKGHTALATPARPVSTKAEAVKPSHWLWSMKEGKCGDFAIQKDSVQPEKFQQNIFLVAACPAVSITTLHGGRRAPDWEAAGIQQFLDIPDMVLKKNTLERK